MRRPRRALVAAVVGLAIAGALAQAPAAPAQTGEPTVPAPVPAGAAAEPDALAARSAPALDADTAALVEPVTGDVVYTLHGDRRHAIASTTKLMTALLVLERDPLGRVFASPGYSPVFSDESLINLGAGERMTVADLLRGLLLASGNDAAIDLAYNTAGSVGAFVAQMNRRARQLGLRQTHYSNPIGLDAAGNYSSALDLVHLAIVLRRRAWFARTVDRPNARLHGSYRTHTVVNRNDLVRSVPFVNGVKTGHTPDAGYVLVGSGTRNGVTMVSAVLGEPGVASRDVDTLALLRYGFSRYRSDTVFGMRDVIATARVRYRESDRVDLVPARAFSTVVRRGERPPALVVHAPRTLTGPLPAGHRVGHVDVRYRGRMIARVPLLTAAKVPAVSLLSRAGHVVFRPGSLAIALLLVLIVAVAVRRGRASGHRGRAGGTAGSRDHHRHTQRGDRQDAGGAELPARTPPP